MIRTRDGFSTRLTYVTTENRPNLQSMLRHEQLQSKEIATAVMSKIMAAGKDDLKVNNESIIRHWNRVLTHKHIIRLVQSLNLLLERYKRRFKTW